MHRVWASHSTVSMLRTAALTQHNRSSSVIDALSLPGARVFPPFVLELTTVITSRVSNYTRRADGPLLPANVASDAVTVLENHQSFAPLRLFLRGCGSLCPSSRSVASEKCQHPAHKSPTRTTSRSARDSSAVAFGQAWRSQAGCSSAPTGSPIAAWLCQYCAVAGRTIMIRARTVPPSGQSSPGDLAFSQSRLLAGAGGALSSHTRRDSRWNRQTTGTGPPFWASGDSMPGSLGRCGLRGDNSSLTTAFRSSLLTAAARLPAHKLGR